MKNALVSIIITSKNEEAHIKNLLESIKKQTYSPIEIIVVDNNSVDKTKAIAKQYTPLVFNKGPERSAQRNFGAQKAKGDYFLFLDADMELEPEVVSQCVKVIKSKKVGAIIIPEESFGEGFWAKVKAFERSFYVGDETIEAARFYDRKVFFELGGFNEIITGPEDWEFFDRVKKKYSFARIKSFIRHNEGKLTFGDLMKKKFYYAKNAQKYLTDKKITFSPKTIFFLRSAFYKKPQKIVFHPILTIAMVAMLALESIAGGYGFYKGRQKEKNIY